MPTLITLTDDQAEAWRDFLHWLRRDKWPLGQCDMRHGDRFSVLGAAADAAHVEWTPIGELDGETRYSVHPRHNALLDQEYGPAYMRLNVGTIRPEVLAAGFERAPWEVQQLGNPGAWSDIFEGHAEMLCVNFFNRAGWPWEWTAWALECMLEHMTGQRFLQWVRENPGPVADESDDPQGLQMHPADERRAHAPVLRRIQAYRRKHAVDA